MTKFIVDEQNITKARICRLSFDGRTKRHQVDIENTDLLKKIAKGLKYTKVRGRENFNCTVGETRYIVTIKQRNDSEIKVVVRNNSVFAGDDLLGAVDGVLVKMLEDLALSVRATVVNPAKDLLALH